MENRWNGSATRCGRVVWTARTPFLMLHEQGARWGWCCGSAKTQPMPGVVGLQTSTSSAWLKFASSFAGFPFHDIAIANWCAVRAVMVRERWVSWSLGRGVACRRQKKSRHEQRSWTNRFVLPQHVELVVASRGSATCPSVIAPRRRPSTAHTSARRVRLLSWTQHLKERYQNSLIHEITLLFFYKWMCLAIDIYKHVGQRSVLKYEVLSW